LGELEVLTDQTIVSVVGNKLTHQDQLMTKMFDSLAGVPVNMVSYGGSLHNVSILVPTSFKNDTLKVLNKGLFGLD
jgi:aspartate kinase